MSSFDPRAFFVEENAPNTAKFMAFNLLDADVDKGWIKVGFTAKEEFLNPMGFVQGGFLTAMMDDTMGPAIIVKTKGKYMAQSVDLHTHFLRPVKMGSVTTEGQVVQVGRTIAYVEAKLFDARGRYCAKASSSFMLNKLN